MSMSPYGAHKTLRALNFVCNAPQAQSVSLVGDFNGWNPEQTALEQKLAEGLFLELARKLDAHVA